LFLEQVWSDTESAVELFLEQVKTKGVWGSTEKLFQEQLAREQHSKVVLRKNIIPLDNKGSYFDYVSP
jgi:hypothetical protein